MTGTGIVVLLIAAFLIWAVVKYVRQQSGNAAEGVIAEFRDLRLTLTELIEGYGRSARRHPRAGMRAIAEDSNHHTVYLSVQSANGAIFREVALGERPNAGVEARAFAAQINSTIGPAPFM